MANGLTADRFTPRPPIQPQHSSSVPSTPYQQPRDMRFSASRSPSPHRGLANQSPRSVVSETVVGNRQGSQRNDTGCRFEIVYEERKRRVPYAEGRDQPLGPPTKEPKKTLAPHEEKKLSADMRELYDRILPSEESEERRRRLVKKLEEMMRDKWPGNDIQVNVFGSSGNLLSSSDSDVDICVTTPMKELESMHALAALLDRHGMQKVECRSRAKVPIVKCWDPELMLACDLNVNNPLALENTRMIKTYVQLDPRIRPLAKVIKYWTKRRILNDAASGGTISSYTWICMIINFLQRRDPPVVPSLQKTEAKRTDHDRDEPSRFADDLDALKGGGARNKETEAQLLFHFFRHYGYEFNYRSHVVSVKEGRSVTREEKGWQPSNYHEKEAQKQLCVEEPFTTTRNLGNTADDYSWPGVHTEIRRAFELLADGQQLEKCCEQYEFPPEENRLVFQRPTKGPAPTLRRSASQSGRPNHEQGSGRSGRKTSQRNQSAQRAGSRRASSGASFGNQRLPLPLQSPPIGVGALNDYFGKSNVHEYLSHQYQLLQQQRDALTAQLQQQQQQAQTHGQPQRVGDLTGSPLHRGGGFQQNGLPSPRFLENPPQTAPLLPGYLYHYPARYPPPSTMSQARSREGGTNTNPSSPSLMAAAPALRRQVHRASITDGTGSSSSARSQSQPGRSIPHLLALQQQVHPGYDVSGAIPANYQTMRAGHQLYGPAAGLGMQYSTPPLPTLHSMDGGGGSGSAAANSSAMPKEYVGYAISPHFGPQQYATQHQQSMQQVPHMTLRDPPPQRQRRVTPDLQPPMPNGKHASRSPSPLSHPHLRSYSTTPDLRLRSQAQGYEEWRARSLLPQSQTVSSPSKAQPLTLQSPERYEPPMPPSIEQEMGGPLIVNGSTPSAAPKLIESGTNGVPAKKRNGEANGAIEHELDLSHVRSLPLRTTGLDRHAAPERIEIGARPHSPQRVSPSVRPKQGPRLNLSPNGTSPSLPNGLPEAFHDPSPLTAPLLSPVAELRTPSPTRTHVFDRQESPRTNGLSRATHIANVTKQVERSAENGAPPMSLQDRAIRERQGTAVKQADRGENGAPLMSLQDRGFHERQGSAPNPVAGSKLPAKSPTGTGLTPGSASGNQNPWQQVQAGKKGHKKSKSTSAPSSRASGQPVPVNESERKGG